MSESPICKMCGNPVTRFVKSTQTWWGWCSNKCMGIDPDIRIKKAATNQKKFGGHPMHNAECRQKLKNAIQEKYGVDNPSKNEDIKRKMRAVFLQNYGVDNPSKNQKIIDKIQVDAIARWSDEKQKDQMMQKRRSTYLQNTGFTCNKHYHIPKESICKMKDLEWLSDQHFVQKKSIDKIAEELGISPTPILKLLESSGIKVRRFAVSSVETEIKNFLTSITNRPIILNNRNIIFPHEIDILIPDFNLAIELNGVYWHCEEKGKNKSYHLNKTNLCENQNIQLLHIYDIEWQNEEKQQIIKSKIKHQLGQSKRIFARKCEVKEISNIECKKFLNETHLQGYCPSKVKLGLFCGNKLCAAATFGKSRYNKNYEWELLRYSNDLNSTVVGGLSKLMAHFIKIYCPRSIISYADRRWSTTLNNLYETIGFTYIGNASPNYKYFHLSNNISLKSRNQFQKHKLKNKLEIFDSALSEYENMSLNGYYRIWDCGNLIFSWKNKA